MSEINKYVARLNTDQGVKVDSRKAVVAKDGGNHAVIYQDAATKQLVIEVLSGTTVVATAGRIILNLGDVDDAPTGYREAKFRQFVFKNADDGCTDWAAWILMTEPRPA